MIIFFDQCPTLFDAAKYQQCILGFVELALHVLFISGGPAALAVI